MTADLVEQIIPPAQEQPKERLDRLLSLHARPLERVAASYARTAPEREDLLQDIAVALWLALPGFRGDCSERTFILRIHSGLATQTLGRPSAGDKATSHARPRV